MDGSWGSSTRIDILPLKPQLPVQATSPPAHRHVECCFVVQQASHAASSRQQAVLHLAAAATAAHSRLTGTPSAALSRSRYHISHCRLTGMSSAPLPRHRHIPIWECSTNQSMQQKSTFCVHAGQWQGAQRCRFGGGLGVNRHTWAAQRSLARAANSHRIAWAGRYCKHNVGWHASTACAWELQGRQRGLSTWMDRKAAGRQAGRQAGQTSHPLLTRTNSSADSPTQA